MTGFECGQIQDKIRPSESKPRPRRGKNWGDRHFQGLGKMDSSEALDFGRGKWTCPDSNPEDGETV